MMTRRPDASVVGDDGECVGVDQGSDDVVHGLFYQRFDLALIPSHGEVGELIPNLFQLVVIRADHLVHEVGDCGARQHTAVEEPGLIQRRAKRQGRRLGNNRLVEIKKRRAEGPFNMHPSTLLGFAACVHDSSARWRGP